MLNKYYFTSTDLISSVKRRINLPDSQSMVSDQDILDYANEEMALKMVPMILSQFQDYYLVREDVLIDITETKYPIPYRAAGNKIQELMYTPNLDDRNDLREFFRISIEDLGSHDFTYNAQYGGRFYIEGENVVLHVDTVSPGYLVFFYYLRPNSLVTIDRVATVQAIDASSGQIVVDEVPSIFTTADQYDFVMKKSPHKIITYDFSLTNINTVTKTITMDPTDVPDTLAIGDRISLAGETDLVNCPSDLHVMLAQTTAARVLESIGDVDNLSVATAKLREMEHNGQMLISNRVIGSPRKIKSRTGLIRGNGRYRRGR